MLTCDEATTLLWYPLHQMPLTTRDRVGLQSHLLACPNCRSYQKTFDWVIEVLEQAKEIPKLSASYKMPEATKAKISARVADEISDPSAS